MTAMAALYIDWLKSRPCYATLDPFYIAHVDVDSSTRRHLARRLSDVEEELVAGVK